MSSPAEKTVKTTNAARHKGAQETFFRKADEQSFFGGKETSSFFGGNEQTHFFPAAPVQPKLSVSTPDDPYEKEADSVADKVMRMPEPMAASPVEHKPEDELARKEDDDAVAITAVQEAPEITPLQRKCVDCEGEEHGGVQAKLYSIQRQEAADHDEEAPDIQAKFIPQRHAIQRKGRAPPLTVLQRKCSTCAEEEHGAVQAKLYVPIQRQAADQDDDEPPAVQAKYMPQQCAIQRKGRAPPSISVSFLTQLNNSKGAGNALPDTTRRFMEQRFQADFSDVRVHIGANAAAMSGSISAQAFTHGNDIYFNNGEYSPDTAEGGRLLAHELTHTIQQQGGRKSGPKYPAGYIPKTGDIAYHNEYSHVLITAGEESANVAIVNGESARDDNQAGQAQAGDGMRTVRQTAVFTPVLLKDGGGQFDEKEIAGEDSATLERLKQTSKPEQKAVNTTETSVKKPAASSKTAPAAKKKASPEEGGQHESADKATVPGKAKPVTEEPPTSPEEDPAFQKVVGKTKAVAKAKKANKGHKVESEKIDKAAKTEPEERIGRAQAKQVDKMGGKKPQMFNEVDFKKALKDKIEKTMPNPATLEGADKFKESSNIGETKAALGQEVGKGKEQAQNGMPGTVQEAPPLNEVPSPFKEVVPLEKLPVGAKPAIDAKGAAPKPKSDAQISQEAQSRELDDQYQEGGITSEQLQESNEPTFVSADASKKDAQDKAAQAPEDYRKDETAMLKGAAKESNTDVGKETGMMHAVRNAKMDSVLGHQGNGKTRDEENRVKVTAGLKDIYDRTKSSVDTELQLLDTDVNTMFDNGEVAARKSFEDHVKERMDAYKDDRYSGWFGWARWLKDKAFDMPDVVNTFFEEGRKLYIDEMDKVIDKISTRVADGLNKAYEAVEKGLKDVDDFISKQPDELKTIAKEEGEKIKTDFDQLQQSVNEKQDALVDSLAKKYTEKLKEVDARIEQMKADTKGFVTRAKEAIKGVIRAIGRLKDMLFDVLRKIVSVIGSIIAHPIRFLGNLIDAVKLGVNNFREHIGDNLRTGFMMWLTGAMPAGIVFPQVWNIEGIFMFVMQVLGFSWENIRERAVNKTNEATVRALEVSFEIFQVIRTEGFAGLWRHIAEQIGNLESMIIEKAVSYLKEAIVVAGIKFILGLLTPVGAFIKACMAIYDIIMFFVRNAERIMDLINAIIDSIALIVAGSIDGAAKKVEQALVKSIPIAIDFLASILGISGITDKIQAIIKGIRSTVNRAIDWVLDKAIAFSKKLGIDKVVAGAKGAMNKGKEWAKDKYEKGKEWAGDKVEQGKAKIKALYSLLKEKRGYKDSQGHEHLLYFEGSEDNPKLMRKSIPELLDVYLKDVSNKINAVDAADPKKPVYLAAYDEADKEYVILTGEMKRLSARTGKLEDTEMTQDRGKKIRDSLSIISKALAKLPEDFTKPDEGGKEVPQSHIEWPGGVQTTKLPGAGGASSKDGVKVVADPLTMKSDGKSGSTPSYYSDLWRALKAQNRSVIAGHLLNHNLFGTGAEAKNLVPIPGSVNTEMSSKFEEPAKKKIFSENKVLYYEVEAIWGNSLPSAVPSGRVAEEFLVPSEIRAKAVEKVFKSELFKGKPAEEITKAKANYSNWKDSSVVLAPPPFKPGTFTVSAAGSSLGERINTASVNLDAELRADPNLLWTDFSSQYVSPLQSKLSVTEYGRFKDTIEAEFHSKQKHVTTKEFDKRYFDQVLGTLRAEVNNITTATAALNKEVEVVRQRVYSFRTSIQNSSEKKTITASDYSVLFADSEKMLDRLKTVKSGVNEPGIAANDFDAIMKDLQAAEAKINIMGKESEVTTALTTAEVDKTTKKLTDDQKLVVQDRINRIRKRMSPEQTQFQKWVEAIHEFEEDLKGGANKKMSWIEFYNSKWMALGDVNTVKRAVLAKSFPPYVKP